MERERDSEENQMKMNGDEKVRVDEDEDCSELLVRQDHRPIGPTCK
jgi:hypothetical protein